ncbi:hypothetical protein KIL84_003761 [Mauremys mutica]|uniref:Uncharacterized protein n=1 Tax=Mauremys mutica TaxID=74926 RepID=A0A9D3WVT8_9SAUR|nr:hypothetical protein KIL84_003761 [Mauremys mutica]
MFRVAKNLHQVGTKTQDLHISWLFKSLMAASVHPPTVHGTEAHHTRVGEEDSGADVAFQEAYKGSLNLFGINLCHHLYRKRKQTEDISPFCWLTKSYTTSTRNRLTLTWVLNVECSCVTFFVCLFVPFLIVTC